MSNAPETVDSKYEFDKPLECVLRAIRGFDRKDFFGSEDDALNILQVQFPTMTRNELQSIYRTYDDAQGVEI